MSQYDYPITPRENYFRLMKNEDPQYLCHEHAYTNSRDFFTRLNKGRQ